MTRLMGKFVIHNNIQELRRAREMTQQDLADVLQITRATVIALEKGSYNPSLELAFRIAQFFKLTIDQIFFIGDKRYE